MTISYNHTSFPTQQLIYPPSAASQLIGKPLAGARVFTYSSLNHATPKTTYQTNIFDPGPPPVPPPALPNPVVANAIGQVTIYWALDDSDPTDLYYVEIKGPTGDDTLYYSYDNFDGAAIIGVTPSSETIDFNLVRNPQFTFNRFKPYPATYILTNEDNGGIDNGIYVADDWKFTKSNPSTVENISITPFTLGQTSVPHNPVNYLSWNVTTAGSGETYKKIFQEYKSVQTLSAFTAPYTLTFQFWARSSSSASVTVDFRQYFGSGGSPSVDVVTAAASPYALSSTWTQYTGSIAIPSVSGKSLGSNGDDKLMFEINFPLNATIASNIDITNIQIEFGTVANAFQYETPNDQRKRLDPDWFGPPTGDIKYGVGLPANSPGWLTLSSTGTIGNAASGATFYASENAYALYAMLWGNTIQANCAVSSGRGASALADFNANKTIALPTIGGRFPLSLNSPDSALLLDVGGSYTVGLVADNLPAHTHALGNVANSNEAWSVSNHQGGADGNIAKVSAVGAVSNLTVTGNNTTAGTPVTVTNPFIYFYTFIKL